MQFMLEEYKDVRVGKTLIKQAGQIEVKRTEDKRYKVKVYGMEDVADIVFKTAEEAAYFMVTWKKLGKKDDLTDDIREVADTIRECDAESTEEMRQKRIKNSKKKPSLIKRFKKWLIKKLEKSLNKGE